MFSKSGEHGVSGLQSFSAMLCGAALFVMTAVPGARGAEFKILRLPGLDNVIVTMRGAVTEGDARRFSDTVATLGGAHATLNVSGPGGLVNEALDIGAQVQEHQFATMVSSQAECYSSCALIWLAGTRRYIAPDSVIGVHAAFRTRGDTAEESGVSNAKIGAFLNMIGLPLDAISYITTAPPDATLPITPLIARMLGIEVFEQQGLTVITPEDAPTAYVRARQTAELAAIATQCSALLQLDPAIIRQTMERNLKQAHEDFGGNRMAEIISWMPSKIRADVERDGVLKWCFDAAPRLRAEHLSFGFDGPSFDCAKASSQTERAICENPLLWGPDRAMSTVYSYRRTQATPEMKSRLREAQRSWISRRAQCKADTRCLTEVYRRRLAEFGLE